MTYELVNGSGDVIATPGAHLLSPKDLAGISMLPRLVEAGVSALKIEGRMKNPEYVALVTGVYRAALDRAAADPDGYAVRDGELAVLSESFSRGFTEAYLLAERGNEMMSYQRPNNRGVFVGRVVQSETSAVTVALESQLDAEDTIEFWTSSGRFAQAVGPLSFDGAEHQTAPAGVRATIRTERSAVTGDRVFRVRNAALAAAARRTFERPDETSPVELAFCVRVVAGQPLRVLVEDGKGRTGLAQGGLVEPARTKAVTAEEIAEHVGRLGGTPYRIGRFDLELSPGVGVGFSALHRLRREALAAYETELLSPWSSRERSHPTLPRAVGARLTGTRPAIVAEAEGIEAALACLGAGADRACVPIHALDPGDVPRGIVPLLPRVLHDRETAAALRFATKGRTVTVGNLGLIGPASDAGAVVEAHWSLNALNAYSVDQLTELGAELVWLSPELSGRQVAEVCAATQTGVGIAVWGRQEVMVTEHCVLMAEGECDRRCGACPRRRGVRRLRDRKGYEFPVQTDIAGRTHVFNSVRLDLTAALPEIIDSGAAALRVDVHTESPQDAAAAVAAVVAAREAVMAGRVPVERPRAETTSGHFFRGLT
jgi:U32 family peptidase